MVTSIKLLEFY